MTMSHAKSFFLLPGNLTLRFGSESGVLDEKAKILLKAYVPGITELLGSRAEVDIVIEHKEDTRMRIEEGENLITLYGSWGDELLADLYHLIYAIVRVRLLKNKLFSVHGACCVLGKEGATLLLGHSGSGKTSVALRLAEEHGMQIVAGNKTVVSFDEGVLRAVAGTTTTSVRAVDGEKVGSDSFSYRDRHISDSGSNGIFEKSVPIRSVALVRLNDFTEECTELKGSSALHSVFPYFLDTVNANVIFGDSVFVGTPPSGTEDFLAKQLLVGLRSIPVFSCIGSASFVAEQCK